MRLLRNSNVILLSKEERERQKKILEELKKLEINQPPEPLSHEHILRFDPEEKR